MTKLQTDLEANSAETYRLWIDGVGGFLLCCSKSVTVGSSSSADIAIRAPISRQHATINFDGENWEWRQGESNRRLGRSPESLQLGQEVLLNFSQPHPWSQTARLTLQSSHRFIQGIDGYILMQRECLLGPTSDCHIRCPEWTETVVISRVESQFRWHRLTDVVPSSQTPSKQDLLMNHTLTLSSPDLPEVQIRMENLEFSKAK